MGIHGLWQVLEPTGRPVNIHSLRGKVLAIDVSIWLHQLVKGFRDKDGNPLPNAHLLGIFHRVCKLLNYGIKPVFVFDGGVPVLKRQTLAARRQRKLESLDKAELSRQKILSAYLRQQIQRQAKTALPPSLRMQAEIEALKRSKSVSPQKRGSSFATSSSQVVEESKVDKDLEAFRAALIAKLEDDVDQVDPQLKKGSEIDSDDEEGSSTDRYQYGVDYSENFSIIQAPDFDTLPLETQHEILFEMQESRKMNSWGKFDKMPKDLQSFSNFQMDRLVKRRTLQKKIQSVQQEMGQRHIHVQNLDDLLKMDYSGFDKNETKASGSRDDGFVLIKSHTPAKGKGADQSKEPKAGPSSKKTPDIITIDDFVEGSSSDEESNKIISVMVGAKGKIVEAKNKAKESFKVKSIPSDEEDADIKLAIKLSLEESGKSETDVKKDDDNLDNIASNSTPLDTAVQHQQEPNDPNAHNGGTEKNESEKKGFLIDSQFSQMAHCAKFLDTIGFHVSQQPKPHSENDDGDLPSSKQPGESSDVKNGKNIDESESDDDDFEEVEETIQSSTPATTVTTIDLSTIKNDLPPENDIFADVFTHNLEKPTEEEAINTGREKSESESALSSDEIEERERVKQAAVVFTNETQIQETSWGDSDSEIEADLLEMVIKESATSIKLNESESNRSNSGETKSEERFHKNDGNVENKESDKKTDGNSVKMITAGYMQAQEQLNTKLGKLHSEMGQQERVATSISDQMQVEAQELISLFGIPYIISPTEAESQCAFLDRACLTEGTITDDSDVWLFGGQRVYKNFFSQGQKHVELYQSADIQRVLNLNREKLIALAIMIGSDYSDGIQGVGPVLALEILSEFTSTNVEGFEILIKFREWWDSIQNKPLDVFAGSKLKEKLRKLKLRPGFPSKAVHEAFMNPTVDTSTEAFKWGNPDIDAIRTYTKQKFGWDQSKCDSLLLPVLKKRHCELDQSRQLTLDSYISFGKLPSLDSGGKRKKGSKRLETAVKKLKRVGGVEYHELNLSSDESDKDLEEKSSTKKKSVPLPQQKKKATKRVAKRKESKSSLSGGENADKKKRRQEKEATASQSNLAAVASTSTKMIQLTPKKAEVIPQRIQSESDKMKNKQKAIEIFKKGKK